MSAIASAGVLALGVTAAPAAATEWSPVAISPRVVSEPIFDEPLYARPGFILMSSVSCASPSFCMAVGSGSQRVGAGKHMKIYERGYALTFDGSRFQAPVRIHGRLAVASVSCSSPSFCGAVGNQANGNTIAAYGVVFNGHRWGNPVLLSGAPRAPDRESERLVAISCTAGGFCAAVGSRGATVVLAGGSWRMVAPSSPLEASRKLSCVLAWDCVTIVNHEAPLETRSDTSPRQQTVFEEATTSSLTRGGWSASRRLASAYRIASLSCAGTRFCLAANQGGTTFLYDGSTWAPGSKPAAYEAAPLSCATPSFCLAIDQPEFSSTFNGRTWTSPAKVDPSPYPEWVLGATWGELLSCAAPEFCLAFGGGGANVRGAG